MNNKEKEILYNFYEKLLNEIRLKSKIKVESLFKVFLSIKSNQAYNFLKNSSIAMNLINKAEIQSLVLQNLVRLSDKPDEYVITANGIWEIEKNNDTISENKLLNIIDEKFFNRFYLNTKLTDKEKIVIFSMLTARTFSMESALDLKKGDQLLEKLEYLIIECYKFLTFIKVINELQEKDLFGKVGNEHPVSNLIRHTDLLPKKTRGIFKATGKQKYFLDLSEEKEIRVESLRYLLRVIFDSVININGQEVAIFLKQKTYDYMIYLFDMTSHVFSAPKYDFIIEEEIEFFFEMQKIQNDSREN